MICLMLAQLSLAGTSLKTLLFAFTTIAMWRGMRLLRLAIRSIQTVGMPLLEALTKR